MKVAIISKYYKNYNFGGLLQAYALTKVIENLGHSVCQISYWPDEKKKYGLKSYLGILLRKIARECVIKIRAGKCIGINENMRLFMESIPHTKKVTTATIASLNSEFDCFIAGSDQIWNPDFSYDEYFLTFVTPEKLKISYAASIGVTSLNETQKTYFRKTINNFDLVSVREFEGQKLLRDIGCAVDVQWVLDPTMLMNQKEWEKLDCIEKMNVPQRYILVYSMSHDESKEKLLNEASQKYGLPVIRIPFTVSDYGMKGQSYIGIGPKEFVSLIRHAEIVFTDSFHATIFSIINHKMFYNMQRDKTQSMNSRIESLYKLFEINPRWVSTFADIENIDNQIDYNHVEEILDVRRENSMDFLKNSLQIRKEISC